MSCGDRARRCLIFQVQLLHGITELSADADLDIGDHSFTAGTLVAKGQPAGRVAVFGSGGALATGTGLLFDGDVLSTPRC